jgi:malate synthase
MSNHPRVLYRNVQGATEILTPDFLNFFASLDDAMYAQLAALRTARAKRLRQALRDNMRPASLPPSEATLEPWQVPPLPAPLTLPGIEISGPASNSFHDGSGAQSWPRRRPCRRLSRRRRRLRRALSRRHGRCGAQSQSRGRGARSAQKIRSAAKVIESSLVRCLFSCIASEAFYLDEHDLTIDGHPVAASLLGIAATLFHAGRSQVSRGESINFYLPKAESVAEVQFYRAIFDHARARLPYLAQASIRAIILVESLPAAFDMEEMLFALGPYAAGTQTPHAET